MAAEDLAVILQLSGINPTQFTCADDTSISKGTLLMISADVGVLPTTAAANEKFAGITAADKVANDGSTQVAVHVPGSGNYFDIKNSAAVAITAGEMVALSGINLIRSAVDAEFESGQVVGQSMETAGTDEVIRVRV